MLQPLFLLFFGYLPFDDSLMPPLKVPDILVPLPPLLWYPLHHPLHLMLPRLSLLPVHGPEDPQPPLLSPPDHRTRAHLVMRSCWLHVVVQVLVTLCGRWVLHEGSGIVSGGMMHWEEFQVYIGPKDINYGCNTYCRLRFRMLRIDFFKEFWCSEETPAVEGLCELISWKVVRRSRISRITFTL